MADGGDRAGGTSGRRWVLARRVAAVAMVAVAALWAYGTIRWIQEGEPAAALTNALVAAACLVWLATFGRGKRRHPSTAARPGSSTVRVGQPRVDRFAVTAAALLVLVSLGRFDGRRESVTAASIVFGLAFGLLLVGAIALVFRKSDFQLVVTDSSVTTRTSRFMGSGEIERSRPCDGIDGYRLRFGSVELVPPPSAAGGRGRPPRSQQVVIPTQLLVRDDVERALTAHGVNRI